VVALYENAMTSVGNVSIYSSEFAVPQNLSTTDNTSNIVVSWDAVENATSYEVYRNNKFLAEVETTSYTDGDFLKDEELCYQVRAIFGNNKSAFTKEVCITTTGDMIEEIGSKVEIYPNPVNDILYIEAETEILTMEIYDVYGRRQVTETPSHQGNLVIDLSELKSGIYFVKINTTEGNIVKRIIKN
jgi:fibronectin type 3 domain-containing protein